MNVNPDWKEKMVASFDAPEGVDGVLGGARGPDTLKYRGCCKFSQSLHLPSSPLSLSISPPSPSPCLPTVPRARLLLPPAISSSHPSLLVKVTRVSRRTFNVQCIDVSCEGNRQDL